MNYYQAKFLRENKKRPTDWIITTDRTGECRLVHLKPTTKTKESK